MLLSTVCTFPLFAQDGKEKGPTPSGAERVQSLKVAFITKYLSLTPEEAQLFWPVYNEYQDKRDVIRNKQAENRKKIKEQSEQLSEAELQKLADEEITFRQQDVALQAEMHEKLHKILPAKKLALLYVAEEEFKKELIRILTEEKKESNTKTWK
ncbi:MAG: hypothetical protein Fur0041_12790 [Bacteroidia bacterium]